MNAVAEKFAILEREISAERGPFTLFALLARDDLPDRWDLLVAAPWFSDQQQAVSLLVDAIKAKLGPEELVGLSRIVVAPSDAPAVQAFNQAFHVAHGIAEIKDSNLFGLAVRHAFVITSQRPTSSAA